MNFSNVRFKLKFDFSVLIFRNGIFKIDESTSLKNDMTPPLPHGMKLLSTLLSNYKVENIFNAKENGLFYQCLPNKTYHLLREKCFRGKIVNSD